MIDTSFLKFIDKDVRNNNRKILENSIMEFRDNIPLQGLIKGGYAFELSPLGNNWYSITVYNFHSIVVDEVTFTAYDEKDLIDKIITFLGNNYITEISA